MFKVLKVLKLHWEIFELGNFEISQSHFSQYYYLEYNSTINCSLMFSGTLSLSG
jgi:hypothetical protein